MTRRLPERMLLGSVAVPDIVLAHRVSDPDRVIGGVRWPLAVAVAVARWPTPHGGFQPRYSQGRSRSRRLVSHPE